MDDLVCKFYEAIDTHDYEYANSILDELWDCGYPFIDALESELDEAYRAAYPHR